MSAPQTPGFLPGQNPVGYGMTPGVHHDTGMPAPPAPYGMLPGQRHVLPDQINLDPQPVKPDNINLDDPGFGNRADGTPKGNGFLGVLKRPDGNVSTELSIGVNIGGKEVEIPSLVPTLTEQEKQLLLSLPDGDASKIPQSIVDKATAFAQSRIAAGKSPFADNSESAGGSSGPGVLPQTHFVRSFRVTNAKGETVADLPDNPQAGSGNDYYKSEVQKIGDSLISQAVNPADKEAAARATQFGLSLVGLMPIKDIQTAIVHRYDTDERNSISREVQDAKSKRAAAMGHGGPALGPSKADKYSDKMTEDLWKHVDTIINQDRTQTKYAAINEQENSIGQMEQMMSSANSMAQRIAVMEQLKNETGKVAVESERAGITGAAGKWEEIKNKLSLWTSEDPQLSERFVAEFRGMLATQRKYIAEAKERLGRETAAAVRDETAGYSEEQRQAAADAAYGRMTGRHSQAYVPPHERAAAQPAAPAPTGGPAVSPHLSKYLKQ